MRYYRGKGYSARKDNIAEEIHGCCVCDLTLLAGNHPDKQRVSCGKVVRYKKKSPIGFGKRPGAVWVQELGLADRG